MSEITSGHTTGFDLHPLNPVFLTFDDTIAGKNWFFQLPDDAVLEPGTLTPKDFAVPQTDAREVLRSVVRFVADLPADGRPLVVWADGDDELLVDISATTITCLVGLVRIGIKVACDQLDAPAAIEVPFAVGTHDRPAGLTMSTQRRLLGPDLIVDRWSDAIVAFAWEALLETARRLAERAGKDIQGRPLIPVAIASGSGTLHIQPMARHNLRD